MKVSHLACIALAIAGMGNVCWGSSISIAPSKDNTIYAENGGASNGAGPLFAGVTAVGNARRALFQFDIAGNVPAGATIDSVTLAVTQTKINGGAAATFELHPLQKIWGQGTSSGTGAGAAATAGEATWTFNQYNSTSWTSAGGDFGLTSGSLALGTANQTYTFPSSASLVSDVQGWLNSPSTNFGWLMKVATETGNTAREFGSTESGSAPSLTINYTSVPEPATASVLGITGLLLMRRRRAMK